MAGTRLLAASLLMLQASTSGQSGAELDPWRAKVLFKSCCGESRSLYTAAENFSVPNVYESADIELEDYMGKYWTLNALIEEYKEEPFDILAFPCNQFGLQEPGANASEILGTLRYIRPGTQQGDNYEPMFPLTKKIEVNGENEIPIFTELKSQCPPPYEGFRSKDKLFYKPMHSSDIRWNFEKFLLDRQGIPRYRFHSNTDPLEIRPYINELLSEARMMPAPKILSKTFRK